MDVLADGGDAFYAARDGLYDAVVSETVLPDPGGKELIRELLAEAPGLPVFAWTAHGRARDAFELARLGARDYVLKDEDDAAFAGRILEAGERGTAPGGMPELPFTQYASRDERTAQVFRTAIERVARAPSTVLISGESGTGKELLARTIHRMSPRRDQPFVAVNCAALPESLIESELFGHEKGAFTGAAGRRIGRFEQADGGTFFLDEAGDLSPAVQAKLLRVLQERTIERIGSNEPVEVDVRVIAATNVELAAKVRSGEFREDLFYRLSVIDLKLPPLRKRPEDIAGLAHYFVQRYRRELGRERLVLAPEAVRALQAYVWPGNVCELENAIERAVVFAPRDRIGAEDLPEHVRGADSTVAKQPGLRAARGARSGDEGQENGDAGDTRGS